MVTDKRDDKHYPTYTYLKLPLCKKKTIKKFNEKGEELK